MHGDDREHKLTMETNDFEVYERPKKSQEQVQREMDEDLILNLRAKGEPIPPELENRGQGAPSSPAPAAPTPPTPTRQEPPRAPQEPSRFHIPEPASEDDDVLAFGGLMQQTRDADQAIQASRVTTPAPPTPASPPAPERAPAPAATPAAPPTPSHHPGHLNVQGAGRRVALVQAVFNEDITNAMVDAAKAKAHALQAEVVHHVRVAGVYDLPLACQRLARRKDVDAVIAIGCVIQGQTKHDEVITHACAVNLGQVSLQTDTPIGLAVIGPGMTQEQAWARIENAGHAVEAALGLVELNA